MTTAVKEGKRRNTTPRHGMPLAPSVAASGNLRFPELAKWLGVAEPTLKRLIQRDDFPRPIRLSERLILWPLPALVEWRDAQAAKAKKEAA